MATLSVCLIMKNEEDVCERVLQSVQPFADEIIVADTGSSDATVEIAEANGAQVFPINGRTILRQRETLPFPKPAETIFFGLTQTMSYPN